MRSAVFGLRELREKPERLTSVRMMRGEDRGVVPAEIPDQLAQQHERRLRHRPGRLDAGDEIPTCCFFLAPGPAKHRDEKGVEAEAGEHGKWIARQLILSVLGRVAIIREPEVPWL